MSERTIALFPLNVVLFPGGPLALRIFEARYLDMISRCLKNEVGFGVALIREGSEVGEAAQTHPVGTYGHISYWQRRDDGMLGVTLRGERRFRILQTEVRPDRLVEARVEMLEPEPPVAVDREHEPLVVMLRDIIDQLSHPWVTLPKAYEDAGWVANRLLELLPMDVAFKQSCLELDDVNERLRRLTEALTAGRIPY